MGIRVLLLSTILLLSLPAQSGVVLKPFKAVYKAQWDMGISFSGEAVRELKRQDDQWQLSLSAKALVASVNEFTRFSLNESLIQPDRYEYHRKVLGNSKDVVLQFNWSTGSVLNDIANKPWTMDVPVGALDSLSYQMQLSVDLANNKPDLIYKVADGGKLKTYYFKRLQTDIIETPVGKYEAIKVERDYGPDSKRSTFIWFAPELDYQVVKMQRIEKSGKEYNLLLDKLEISDS